VQVVGFELAKWCDEIIAYRTLKTGTLIYSTRLTRSDLPRKRNEVI